MRPERDISILEKIKAMRNIVVHCYGLVDSEVTWEIIKEDIPELKSYCTTVIHEA